MSAPACYVVPAAEFQEALSLLVQLPLFVLGGYFAVRFLMDWDEYVWQWRRSRRWLRRRRIRLLSQESGA